MENIVLIEKDVTDFLVNLIDVLFEEGYFGFRESAVDYVDKIFFYIHYKLVESPLKTTPEKIKYLGNYYNSYSINNQTTWYIFFDFNPAQSIYLVSKILNNNQNEIRHLNL